MIHAQRSSVFRTADDGVDPRDVPARRLASGAEIPAIGLGTFGSDRYSGHDISSAVKEAIAVGYRHIDCAAVYGNEPEIGDALSSVLAASIPRDDLWITSKLWNDKHGVDDVGRACEQSLRDLRLDYLDLYLVHWPFPNHHDPGVDVDARDPHARPYIHEQYMQTWGAMERLVERGLVRHIGTSNMTVPKLELVCRDAAILPACNEMEVHPHLQQPNLVRFVQQHGIVPIAFSPIGSPRRPERDKTDGDSVDIEDAVIVRIAAQHDVHPAVVCVKWAVQHGLVPIPFSVNRAKYLSNLRGVASDPLTEAEMDEIAKIDRDCRLIKGHVFLWEGAHDWQDLWDPSGQVTSQ